MESLYFLIPLALVIIILAVKLLFWAINNGQYDDLDTESHRILFDDDVPPQASDTQSASKPAPVDDKQ